MQLHSAASCTHCFGTTNFSIHVLSVTEKLKLQNPQSTVLAQRNKRVVEKVRAAAEDRVITTLSMCSGLFILYIRCCKTEIINQFMLCFLLTWLDGTYYTSGKS